MVSLSLVFLALSFLVLSGAIFHQAHRLRGNGNLWDGLGRLFDSNYQTDQDQNADIEHGLFLLNQRLDAYAPRGWTIEFTQANVDQPPTVRLIINGTHFDGIYLHDSPAELLQKWSLPTQKEEK